MDSEMDMFSKICYPWLSAFPRFGMMVESSARSNRKSSPSWSSLSLDRIVFRSPGGWLKQQDVVFFVGGKVYETCVTLGICIHI